MKKVISLIVIVALIASLSVAFVACNNDGDQKASNVETLGTAVATVAQMTGASSASSAAEAEEAFEAGLSFDLSASANASVGESIQSAFNEMGDVLSEALAECVDGVQSWVGQSNVDITSSASDKEGFDEKITITFTSGEGEDAVSTTLGLYVKINEENKTVDSKQGYTFTATLFYETAESSQEIISINGTATYSEAQGTVVFGFSVGSIAQINAYATEDGKVAIDFGANIGIATFDFQIEVGKLANGTYGATIASAGSVNLGIISADVAISINVTATGVEDAGEFDVNGTFTSTVAVPVVGSFSANATLDGKAVLDTATGDFEVGLTGSLDVQAVEAEQA